MSFRSKEDAIHFAEKQGTFPFACPRLLPLNLMMTCRLGLLRAAADGEEDSQQELFGKLSV